ncbi:hypothetical protein CVT25_006324 [Psilocybe cyanescens]|uniref:Uncharacterized protein n=1 Tax=Psilocybe cyanescens TaxID=93625 RepID=A0A409X3V0_PSICY|nr:hypothetical protein CVT25_006324 [Psilocybe cyanescens]
MVVVTPDMTQMTRPGQMTCQLHRFFENTGAVTGTFAVVGLIILVLFIALTTSVVRRRCAWKFDCELATATLEAAFAPKPIFLDDNDDTGGSGRSRAAGIEAGYDYDGGYGGGTWMYRAMGHLASLR